MIRKTLVALTGALVILAAPVSTFAKNICVQDNDGNHWVFKKVKRLKIPGKVSPIHGIYVQLASRGNPGTIDGSAFVSSGGVIILAVTVLFPGTSVIIRKDYLGGFDDAFNGFFQEVDSGIPPVEVDLSSVNCNSVPFP